jgi:hypothetical protein
MIANLRFERWIGQVGRVGASWRRDVGLGVCTWARGATGTCDGHRPPLHQKVGIGLPKAGNFPLIPAFPAFDRLWGIFLFFIFDLRFLSEMRRQATQSDAQMTQSDAEVTQPFLQINGLRGLLRLSSLAFVFAAKRSECGGRRINQSLVNSSPTNELNGALGRFHAGKARMVLENYGAGWCNRTRCGWVLPHGHQGTRTRKRENGKTRNGDTGTAKGCRIGQGVGLGLWVISATPAFTLFRRGRLESRAPGVCTRGVSTRAPRAASTRRRPADGTMARQANGCPTS